MEERLGQYIRRVRKQNGLTQEDLARQVGITKAYICIIERGDLTGRDVAVSPSKLAAIAKAINVRAEEIFNRAGILPQGTVLVRDEIDDGGDAVAARRESSEYERHWGELCEAGYTDLPPDAREEVKHFIEFRARQYREQPVRKTRAKK